MKLATVFKLANEFCYLERNLRKEVYTMQKLIELDYLKKPNLRHYFPIVFLKYLSKNFQPSVQSRIKRE